MTKLEHAAKVTAKVCLGVTRDESVVVLTDEPVIDIAHLVWKAVLDCKAKAVLVQLPLLKAGEYEDYKIIQKTIKSAEAVISITSQPVALFNVLKTLSDHSARVLTLTALTPNSFRKIYNTDYQAVRKKSRKLSDIFSIGHEVTLTSLNGTQLKIPITRRKGFAVTGMVNNDEKKSELLGGEATVSPIEGGTEGVLIVDSGLGLRFDDKDRIQITVKDGRAYRITGGQGAERLRKALSKYGSEARKLAELGVGTNDVAHLCWDSNEDVKVEGAIHIAFGNNIRIGGTISVPFRTIGVIHKGTLAVDGREIVKNGKLKIF